MSGIKAPFSKDKKVRNFLLTLGFGFVHEQSKLKGCLLKTAFKNTFFIIK